MNYEGPLGGGSEENPMKSRGVDPCGEGSVLMSDFFLVLVLTAAEAYRACAALARAAHITADGEKSDEMGRPRRAMFVLLAGNVAC